jgi:hypothetical protein
MAFGLSKSGKQVFTANGTWTHPMPGVELSVTMLLVGGGGGAQGTLDDYHPAGDGGDGGITSATPIGGTTITAKGGAGGNKPAISGAGRTTQSGELGPAGVGLYGINGISPNAPWFHGQCGEAKLVTVTTTTDITITIGAGGTAGTGGVAGYAGIAIVEW